MAASDHLSPDQFWHMSDHEYQPGDHVVPPEELNPENPRKAMKNPAYGGTKRRTDTTFYTDDPHSADEFGGWGKNTYRVRPLGTESWPDPHAMGEPGHFEHKGHLEILGRGD
jgi:hypothetical protein